MNFLGRSQKGLAQRQNSGEASDPYPTSPHAQGAMPQLANQAQRRSADSRQSRQQGDHREVYEPIDRLVQEIEECRRQLRVSQDQVKHIRDEKDAKIQTLMTNLAETRMRLKVVSESQLRSQERTQAVDDSLVVGAFSQLGQSIKDIVQVLLRNANPKLVKATLFNDPSFQEYLNTMLGGRISISEMDLLIETSPNPLNMLRFVIRAVIFTMVRTKLFNEAMFFGLDQGIRDFYQNLLQRISPSVADDPSIISNLKKDASLWRSQTLSVVDKNIDRLDVAFQREKAKADLASKILQLLDPLSALNPDAGSKKEDVEALIDSAAGLSITLGKQRAMFELQIARFVGQELHPEYMYPVGFDVDPNDDEDNISLSTPHVVIAVVAPALIKYGNADGENYDLGITQSKADVFVIEAVKWNSIKRSRDNKMALPQGNSSDASKASLSASGGLMETSVSMDARRKSAEYSTGKARETNEPVDTKIQRAQTFTVSPIDSGDEHGGPSSIESNASKVSSLIAGDRPVATAEEEFSAPHEEQKVLLNSNLLVQKEDKNSAQAASGNSEQRPSGDPSLQKRKRENAP